MEVAEKPITEQKSRNLIQRVLHPFLSRLHSRRSPIPQIPTLEITPQPKDLNTTVPSESETPSPPVQKPSGRELRKARGAAYEEWKKQERLEPEMKKRTSPSPPYADTKPPEPIIQPSVEEKPADLPPGIKERANHVKTISISQDEIPWLQKTLVEIPLDLMTLATTKGEQFLFGDLIESNRLTEAKNQMRADELKSASDLLFVQLSEFIQRRFTSKDITKVRSAVTKNPIFEVGNGGGQRVHFMLFGKIGNLPVIIRIAVYNKTKQIKVFSVISNETHRETKQKSKL